MGIERERRFLVVGDGWRTEVTGERIRQGYLSTRGPTVRVRVRGGLAWLTIKGETQGTRRSEFEYPIPLPDAEELLGLAQAGAVEKTRNRVEHAGYTWEIDEFAGDNAGLVLAEIELDSDAELDRAVAARPPWLGAEVTSDGRFANASLAVHPLAAWSAEERQLLLHRPDST